MRLKRALKKKLKYVAKYLKLIENHILKESLHQTRPPLFLQD